MAGAALLQAAQAVSAAVPDCTATSTLLAAMKLAADGSSTMATWALSTIAGSVAAIVSTSYLRPADRKFRRIYLLYLPAWVCLGISIYWGHQLDRRHIAAHFVPPARLETIAELMNGDYFWQQDFLAIGLAFLGVWLACYLVWWLNRD